MGNIYFNIVCLYLLEWACSVHPLGDVFSFPDLPGGRLDRPGFQLTGHGHDPLHVVCFVCYMIDVQLNDCCKLL